MKEWAVKQETEVILRGLFLLQNHSLDHPRTQTVYPHALPCNHHTGGRQMCLSMRQYNQEATRKASQPRGTTSTRRLQAE